MAKLYVFLFCSALCITFSASAGMLPEELHPQYLSDQGFISFQEPAGGFTPFFSSLSIDGVVVGGPAAPQVSQLFSDTTSAFIPPGTTIQRLRDSSGKETWIYPLGAEVAHEIVFNDQAHTLFELRMLRKTSATQWDYATYSPSVTRSQNPTLVRNHYSGTAPLSLTLQMSSGVNSRIDLKRINLNSCKNCHFMASQASYQYPTVSEAGPCGFTPGNENGIRNWIDTYQVKFGHSPFSN